MKMMPSIITLIVTIFLAGGVMAETQAATETATFAGGCFWCMDAEFKGIKGVSRVVSGYTGGHVDKPTYEEVSQGGTGHFEAIEITYNPAQVSYAKLLDIFWHNIDPLDETGQFCDQGTQYRAGIFTHNAEQKKLAEESKAQVKKLFGTEEVATIIAPASVFFPAEDYHQDYYIKNKIRYKLYRMGCGRDSRLDEVWKDRQGAVINP